MPGPGIPLGEFSRRDQSAPSDHRKISGTKQSADRAYDRADLGHRRVDGRYVGRRGCADLPDYLPASLTAPLPLAPRQRLPAGLGVSMREGDGGLGAALSIF
jgi:hypothetical protein